MASFSHLPRELQQGILDRLVVDKTDLTFDDRKRLLSPMRVNSFWFHHCADVLWNHLSNLECTFAQMGFAEERRQLYVSKIRIVDLHSARLYFDLIANLKFSSLTYLRLRGPYTNILPFLQPNLKFLQFHGTFNSTRHELDQMARLCPDLCELQIAPLRDPIDRSVIAKPNRDPVDSESFSQFIKGCHQLRRLTLGNHLPTSLVSAALSGIQPRIARQFEELVLSKVESAALSRSISDFLEACGSLRKFELRDCSGDQDFMYTLLSRLADLTELRHLRLDQDLQDDVVEKCIRGRDAPFRNLRSLAIRGQMSPVSDFVSLSMQSLVRLQLWVNDPAHHICPSLSRLSNLTFLNLVIGLVPYSRWNSDSRYMPGPNDWQATPEDIRALSALEKLRSLIIQPSGINLTAPWLTDALFVQWMSSYPHLRDLEIKLECPVSFSGIIALSESHPHLQTLKLMSILRLESQSDLPSPNLLALKQLKLYLDLQFDQAYHASYKRLLSQRFIQGPAVFGGKILRIEPAVGDAYIPPDQLPDQSQVHIMEVKSTFSYKTGSVFGHLASSFRPLPTERNSN
ncbi:hypothetical protein E4T39_05309 [Aureobasidium subglaciale]|nr:hypothetical protein E4T39_05309 [Aureobasidium subglaciale]